MSNTRGTFIATVDGVDYYTDRVVKGEISFQANVGYLEFSQTYDVYAKNWTSGSALNADMKVGKGSISLGVDSNGDVQIGGGYGFADIGLVRSRQGDYNVVVGATFGGLIGGGISISGRSSYSNNLSTYNTINVNPDGSYSLVEYTSGDNKYNYVKVTITQYSASGKRVGKPVLTSVAQPDAGLMGAGLARHIWQLPRCFPAQTPIAVSLTATRPISDIRVGDTVLAFDPAAALGRGALVPRRVTRLYRNTTDTWIRLTWTEDGVSKELVATPGHHMLDRFGSFPPLETMIANGRATVVLASGALAEVTAERIVFSAAGQGGPGAGLRAAARGRQPRRQRLLRSRHHRSGPPGHRPPAPRRRGADDRRRLCELG